MRDRDGGDDGTEGSPGGAHFRVPAKLAGVLNDSGGEAIKDERDEAARISIESVRDVPERCAQEQSKSEVRNSRKPEPNSFVAGIGGEVELAGPENNGRGGDQIPDRRMMAVGDLNWRLGWNLRGDLRRVRSWKSEAGARDASCFPLRESFGDSTLSLHGGLGITSKFGTQLRAHEPNALREKKQQ